MVGLGAPPPQSRWVPPTVVHPSAPSCKSPPRAGCVSLCASPNAAASPRRRHGLSSQLVIRDLDLVMPAHARGGGAPAAPRRGLWPLWPRARSACPRGSCPGLFLSRRSPREAHPRRPLAGHPPIRHPATVRHCYVGRPRGRRVAAAAIADAPVVTPAAAAEAGAPARALRDWRAGWAARPNVGGRRGSRCGERSSPPPPPRRLSVYPL